MDLLSCVNNFSTEFEFRGVAQGKKGPEAFESPGSSAGRTRLLNGLVDLNLGIGEVEEILNTSIYDFTPA